MEGKNLVTMLALLLFLGLLAAGPVHAGYLGFDTQSLPRQGESTGGC